MNWIAWRLNRWWEDEGRYDYPVVICLALVAGLLMIFSLVVIDAEKEKSAERARLMQQCLSDGKKEYECIALLDQGKSTYIPLPIFIPSGR